MYVVVQHACMASRNSAVLALACLLQSPAFMNLNKMHDKDVLTGHRLVKTLERLARACMHLGIPRDRADKTKTSTLAALLPATVEEHLLKIVPGLHAVISFCPSFQVSDLTRSNEFMHSAVMSSLVQVCCITKASRSTQAQRLVLMG